jgi:23S rRNA (guanine745-N1)-methyltransferase
MSGQWRILDAGSGTGHHLARMAEALAPPVVGIGLDISKEAARQAARRWPMLAFAVADLWTEWPAQDAAVDLVISIFAPKNYPEAARVLRPGG